jgi:hypothetical protein
MLKRDELTNPNSCMSRAADDEMTFVLLSRDAAAPATIRFWVRERTKLMKNRYDDAQIVEALDCADAMEAQQEARASRPTPARDRSGEGQQKEQHNDTD